MIFHHILHKQTKAEGIHFTQVIGWLFHHLREISKKFYNFYISVWEEKNDVKDTNLELIYNYLYISNKCDYNM